MCAARRSQAEATGLLWGTYHFGKGDSPGEKQAAFFLDSSRPTQGTLLALDLEPNEGDPSNFMTIDQAEAFVQAIASATAGCRSSTSVPWASRRCIPSSAKSSETITIL
jgi:lysozyme